MTRTHSRLGRVSDRLAVHCNSPALAGPGVSVRPRRLLGRVDDRLAVLQRQRFMQRRRRVPRRTCSTRGGGGGGGDQAVALAGGGAGAPEAAGVRADVGQG